MGLTRRIFTEEQEMFRASFRSFLQKEVVPYQAEWEKTGITPRSIWQKCGAAGFLVPEAPVEYGGLGETDFRFEAVMLEELAAINEVGLLLSVHNTITAPYILSYGSEALKQQLVPRIVSGDCILAIAMTEPGAGSDLASMRTTAIDRGDHWELNGSKIFISNGINADAVVVAAKTGSDASHCMGMFVVLREDAGFERGRRLEKVGMHSQDTAELFFNAVKIPKDRVLGDPSRGFYYMMEKLVSERLSLVVTSVAMAKTALNLTLDYVKQRTVFGKPLSRLQNTQFKLAEMKTEIEIAEVYSDRLIEEFNRGAVTADSACGAKYWTTDLAWRVIDECVQLHGGYGYMLEYPIARLFLNARVGRIYAGTNEIMKTVIAKSMGL